MKIIFYDDMIDKLKTELFITLHSNCSNATKDLMSNIIDGFCVYLEAMAVDVDLDSGEILEA